MISLTLDPSGGAECYWGEEHLYYLAQPPTTATRPCILQIMDDL